MSGMELDTTYEKLLLNFINVSREKMTALEDRTKKFTVKDLDKLTPQLFQQIVMLLFSDKASPELLSAINTGGYHPVKLEKFNKLVPSFDFSYDGNSLKFYVALKKYFPDNLNLLKPYVVLNPSGDPMQTRRVLNFLTMFNLFADKVKGEFEEVYADLEEENEEKCHLKQQLDKLKDEINTRMIELEDWGQQIPQLEEESKKNQDLLTELQLKTEKLEEQVKAFYTTYNSKESLNKQTSREVEIMKKKIQELEQQIVHSPMSIKRDLELEKEKLKELNKRRDILGAQLDNITQRRTSVGHIAVDGDRAIGFFNELIVIMQEAMDLVTSFKEKTVLNQQKSKEIEELESRLENIRGRQVSSMDGIYNQAQSQADALKSLKLDISSTTVKIAELKHEGKYLLENQVRETEQLSLKQVLIMDIEKKIKELEYQLTVEIPAKQTEMENLVRSVLESMRQEFKDI